MDEREFADLVALCQFLPGPASSQVGIGIGTKRAGIWGGVAAWVGFTLPSAVVLLLFALWMKAFNLSDAGWIHGLKIVAVAIVAQAIIAMGTKLAGGKWTALFAAVSAGAALYWHVAWSQVVIITAAGVLGLWVFRRQAVTPASTHEPRRRGALPLVLLLLFVGLLLVLPLLARYTSNVYVTLLDICYRTGSLVFGGGHVVLPLLETEVVPTQLVSKTDFLAGYGLTQAMPGPLFTFASYLGTLIAGIPGAIVALVGIFLPSFLLVVGVMPYWDRLRANGSVRAALVGVNAAVVGILFAAFCNPLVPTGIRSWLDLGLALGLFVMLVYWKLPPWLVVIVGAFGGWVFSII
jgi:chromate transporter